MLQTRNSVRGRRTSATQPADAELQNIYNTGNAARPVNQNGPYPDTRPISHANTRRQDHGLNQFADERRQRRQRFSREEEQGKRPIEHYGGITRTATGPAQGLGVSGSTRRANHQRRMSNEHAQPTLKIDTQPQPQPGLGRSSTVRTDRTSIPLQTPSMGSTDTRGPIRGSVGRRPEIINGAQQPIPQAQGGRKDSVKLGGGQGVMIEKSPLQDLEQKLKLKQEKRERAEKAEARARARQASGDGGTRMDGQADGVDEVRNRGRVISGGERAPRPETMIGQDLSSLEGGPLLGHTNNTERKKLAKAPPNGGHAGPGTAPQASAAVPVAPQVDIAPNRAVVPTSDVETGGAEAWHLMGHSAEVQTKEQMVATAERKRAAAANQQPVLPSQPSQTRPIPGPDGQRWTEAVPDQYGNVKYISSSNGGSLSRKDTNRLQKNPTWDPYHRQRDEVEREAGRIVGEREQQRSAATGSLSSFPANTPAQSATMEEARHQSRQLGAENQRPDVNQRIRPTNRRDARTSALLSGALTGWDGRGQPPMYGNPSTYRPGAGLYLPDKRLDEWKNAGVASLTGDNLDLTSSAQAEADKDKAWWEAGNKGKRSPTTTTFDGTDDTQNGTVFSNFSYSYEDGFQNGNGEDPFVQPRTSVRSSTTPAYLATAPPFLAEVHSIARARHYIGFDGTSKRKRTVRKRNRTLSNSIKTVIQRRDSQTEPFRFGFGMPKHAFNYLEDCAYQHRHTFFHPYHICKPSTKKNKSKRIKLTQTAVAVQTEFKPRLYLKCGPSLRYTGIRREFVPVRPGKQPKPDKEIWRGSVMIVTQDERSSYSSVPTLRLFLQPKPLPPPPPETIDGDQELPQEYIDPIAGHPKVGRNGETLYVVPVEDLPEELDLSKDETDNGLFEHQRTAPQSSSKPATLGQSSDGEKAGKAVAVQGFRLHAERGYTFWRFNIEVELTGIQQRIAYRINHGPATGFTVPARGEGMNVMNYSCNGFSLNVKTDEFCGPDPMWRDVLNTHQTRPFHVMIGGGDQIYMDALMTQTSAFSEWLAAPSKQHKQIAPFTMEMQDELESFYLERYASWFSTGLFGLANSVVPMVNVWDDHDVIDGFGSYSHETMTGPGFTGLGAIAFKYYMLFQHQSSIDETELTEPSWLLGPAPGPYIREQSRNIFLSLGGGISFLGLDCRMERTRTEILSEASCKKIFDRCDAEIQRNGTTHLIVLVGVPIAYPRLVWLETILTSSLMAPIKALSKAANKNLQNPFDGAIEILDDLDDHWTAKHHKAERRWLIEDLQDLAARHSVRVTILSGDVHLGAIGQFYSRPIDGKALPKHKDHRYMPNVISSAIVNCPPQDIVANVLARRDKVHHLDEVTDENMIKLFGEDVDGKKRTNKILMNRRNWCAIRMYNPDFSRPSTAAGSDSATPAEGFGGLVRRLSNGMTTRNSYDKPPNRRTGSFGPHPPISGGGGGLLRRLSSSHGWPSATASTFFDGQRPPAPPRRKTSSLSGLNPVNLVRSWSQRQTSKPRAKRGDAWAGGFEPDSDEELERPYKGEPDIFRDPRTGRTFVREDPKQSRGLGLRGGMASPMSSEESVNMRGGKGSPMVSDGSLESCYAPQPGRSSVEGYFDGAVEYEPAPSADVPRSRQKRKAAIQTLPKPTSGRPRDVPGQWRREEPAVAPSAQPQCQGTGNQRPQYPSLQRSNTDTTNPRVSFHRTPTDTSLRRTNSWFRKAKEGPEPVDLEGGLEVTLNVEVSRKDPAGITAPYRLIVPRLVYRTSGPIRQGDGMDEYLPVVDGRRPSVFKRLASWRPTNRERRGGYSGSSVPSEGSWSGSDVNVRSDGVANAAGVADLQEHQARKVNQQAGAHPAETSLHRVDTNGDGGGGPLRRSMTTSITAKARASMGLAPGKHGKYYDDVEVLPQQARNQSQASFAARVSAERNLPQTGPYPVGMADERADMPRRSISQRVKAAVLGQPRDVEYYSSEDDMLPPPTGERTFENLGGRRDTRPPVNREPPQATRTSTEPRRSISGGVKAAMGLSPKRNREYYTSEEESVASPPPARDRRTKKFDDTRQPASAAAMARGRRDAWSSAADARPTGDRPQSNIGRQRRSTDSQDGSAPRKKSLFDGVKTTVLGRKKEAYTDFTDEDDVSPRRHQTTKRKGAEPNFNNPEFNDTKFANPEFRKGGTTRPPISGGDCFPPPRRSMSERVKAVVGLGGDPRDEMYSDYTNTDEESAAPPPAPALDRRSKNLDQKPRAAPPVSYNEAQPVRKGKRGPVVEERSAPPRRSMSERLKAAVLGPRRNEYFNGEYSVEEDQQSPVLDRRSKTFDDRRRGEPPQVQSQTQSDSRRQSNDLPGRPMERVETNRNGSGKPRGGVLSKAATAMGLGRSDEKYYSPTGSEASYFTESELGGGAGGNGAGNERKGYRRDEKGKGPEVAPGKGQRV